MKAYFTFFFLLIIGTGIGQTTNVKAGVWSDNTVWIAGLVPVDTSNIVLSYDVVVDINAICKSLNANGHSVTVNTGVTLYVSGGNLPADSTFTDSRDGQSYKFRHIGTQVWMTQNLNYNAYDSYCYLDDQANCAVYGRLYNWDSAKVVTPPGWHLPSDSEWTILTTFLGGEVESGGAIKEAGTLHWQSPNSGATNSSGFTGLPGGNRTPTGIFKYIGYYGSWWSSTEASADNAWGRFLGYNYADAVRENDNKSNGFSIRCVRD